MDELFMLVVVGEFNAGKSALINALLGRRLLAEGVTPTTAAIHLVKYGEDVNRKPAGPEANQSHARIRDTIAPYTRFVRSEGERLTSRQDELRFARRRAAKLESDIVAVTS